jgi:APA family basic amino acid/polyamine antiporter
VILANIIGTGVFVKARVMTCNVETIVFVIFLDGFVGGALPPWSKMVLPIVVILLATGLNLFSVRSNGGVATALTAVKVSLVLGVGLGAFLLADGSWQHYAQSGASGTAEGVPEGARGGLAGFGAAMLGALWGYNGWNIIASVGGEVKDPGRCVPRALIGGTCW